MARTALSARSAVVAFLCFAFAYFFSALVRAVTATLAPDFSAEIGLGAADLGLLAGAYFVGFAVMQLPLGRALDRFGPQRVLMGFLALAVIGCVAFALARSFVGLTLARAIAEQHGGSLTLANRRSPDGQVVGLSATIRLPL